MKTQAPLAPGKRTGASRDKLFQRLHFFPGSVLRLPASRDLQPWRADKGIIPEHLQGVGQGVRQMLLLEEMWWHRAPAFQVGNCSPTKGKVLVPGAGSHPCDPAGKGLGNQGSQSTCPGVSISLTPGLEQSCI